jgi:hypothetical protein
VSRVASLVALLLLLLPASAWAQAHLIVSAVGDVRILVDDTPVGNLAALGHAPVVIEQPARHGVQVVTYSGEVLAEQNIALEEGETLAVHWNGESLEVRDADALQLGTRTISSQQQQRRPSVAQTAQAGTTVANILAPTNPVVAGISTGVSAYNAGSTLVQAARDADLSGSREQATAPATSANEDHSLDSLEQSGFDPYAATGGRPSFDASLASVTFVAPAGTEALITIDSQPVATIGDTSEVTVAVMPGMHKVMIFDASGVNLVHRGYLTVTAGYVLELHFSATDPPVSTLPDTWR